MIPSEKKLVLSRNPSLSPQLSLSLSVSHAKHAQRSAFIAGDIDSTLELLGAHASHVFKLPSGHLSTTSATAFGSGNSLFRKAASIHFEIAS